MTLAGVMDDDLSTFYSTDDFAVAATLTHDGVSTSINVLFSNPFRAMNPETGALETTAPMARCKTSDVSASVQGDTLAIAGTTYYVIGIQPGEDGLETVLILSLD